MKFTVDCVGTDDGWRWRVTLWQGDTPYVGKRDYKRHHNALRAAKATGASQKED